MDVEIEDPGTTLVPDEEEMVEVDGDEEGVQLAGAFEEGIATTAVERW
jgi:hypothetical protein